MVPLALCLLILLVAAPGAAAGTLQPPVGGPVLRGFVLGPNPYARGQHRGVDLGAPLGSRVRSACSGRVSFAGRVPGGGRTVSVRCGGLIATHQGLGAIAVRAGERVTRGGPVGSVGRSEDPRNREPHVHLGVREAASRRYLDPLELLGGGGQVPVASPARPPAPGGPARVPAAPRFVAPGRTPALRPRALPVGGAPAPMRPRPPPVGGAPAPPWPRALPHGRAPFAPAGWTAGPVLPAGPSSPWAAGPHSPWAVPWVVWAGLAAIAVALPVGGLVTVRRRSRPAAARAAAAAR